MRWSLCRTAIVFAILFQLSTAVFDRSECGVTKGCLFAPTDCNPSGDCSIFFSYQVINGVTLRMQIFGTPASEQGKGYIAVGFSKDQEMGDDSVTYCSTNNGQTTGGLAHTKGKSLELLNSPLQVLQSSSYTNNQLDCTFQRQLGKTGNSDIYDLNGTYHILVATGEVSDDGTPQYHNLNKWILPRTDVGAYGTDANGNQITYNKSTVFPTNANEMNNTNFVNVTDAIGLQQRDEMNSGGKYDTNAKLRIAHGILMTLGWSIFLGTGILFARYFRNHMPNTEPFGVRMWFHFHRTLNTIGLGCTIAAFVLIFVASDWRWIGPKAFRSQEENRAWNSIHAMLGLLACVIAWAQPLNAVFRCHGDNKARIIFNVLHRFFGMSAWVLAAAAIMIACVHFDAMFSKREAAMGLYIAFIIVAGLTLIVLESLHWKNWWTNRRAVGDGNIEMVRIGGSSAVVRADDEQRVQRLQALVLLLYVAAAIGLSIAICVLIGKQPAS